MHVGNRFDHDFFRQPRADAESGIANLADQTALPTEQFDFLFLAKTHFPEAMGHFGRGGKLFDAHGHASFDLAQRTEERLVAAFIVRNVMRM